MPSRSRAVIFGCLALVALFVVPSSAAAQVRVGVVVGAPFVAAPVVAAPAVPVAPYYPYAYAYSPYYYPYAYGYPYYSAFGFSVGFGGYRYARPYAYRGGYGNRGAAYRGAVVRRHR